MFYGIYCRRLLIEKVLENEHRRQGIVPAAAAAKDGCPPAGTAGGQLFGNLPRRAVLVRKVHRNGETLSQVAGELSYDCRPFTVAAVGAERQADDDCAGRQDGNYFSDGAPQIFRRSTNDWSVGQGYANFQIAMGHAYALQAVV
jgi:hypothetical protein